MINNMDSIIENESKGIKPSSILSLNNITKMFSGTLALKHVNFSIDKGEIHGIIGKNGAGKSTLVNIIAGIYGPTKGEIIIDGKVWHHGISRTKARNQKISIVPQEPQVVLDYTVAENLFMPEYITNKTVKTVNFKEMYKEANRIFKQAGFSVNVEANAGDLTVSERQLLLVIKACYVDNARIIILDEASASLSQKDEQIFYDIVRKSKDEGKTIIFISHHVEEILFLCDRVTVIRDGTCIGTYFCKDLDKKKITRLIVGDNFFVSSSEKKYNKKKKFNNIVLSVNKLSLAGVFSNISFNLSEGEILGFAGLRGSGRTEIFKAIAGIDSFDEGFIETNIFKGRFKNPYHAKQTGVVYLPEDRENEGLINGASVRENIVLNSLNKIIRRCFVIKSLESQLTTKLMKMMDVQAASSEQEVNQLSGGNKQKVVVARIVGAEPRVFILDEPTRGIDISAKSSILNIIHDKLSQKAGVIITSPGLDELIQICDRIVVLYEGEIINEFSRESFNERDLYFAIQGGEKEGAIPI